MAIAALVTIVSLGLMFVASALKQEFLGGVLKMTASTGFMALALIAGALNSWYGLAVLVALFFSWWGDLLLIFRHQTLFLLGLIAFFLGHLGFVAAFLVHGVHPVCLVGTLVVLGIPAAIVIRWLNPGLGDMRVPVYAYIAVISIMVACSAGAVSRGGVWFMTLGAVMFYCSDIFVARDRFIKTDAWNRYLGLPLYYGAQLLMAYTIWFSGI